MEAQEASTHGNAGFTTGWTGDALSGRSILPALRTGTWRFDAVHPLRRAAQAAGARVVVECPKAVARLLASSPGVDRVVIKGEALPACDVYLPLLSLPLMLHITPDNVPAKIPYLSIDDETLHRQKEELVPPSASRLGSRGKAIPPTPATTSVHIHCRHLPPSPNFARCNYIACNSAQGRTTRRCVRTLADHRSGRPLG